MKKQITVKEFEDAFWSGGINTFSHNNLCGVFARLSLECRWMPFWKKLNNENKISIRTYITNYTEGFYFFDKYEYSTLLRLMIAIDFMEKYDLLKKEG